MKRVCGWCKQELGRKCPECGSHKVKVLIPGSLGCAYCLVCAEMWELRDEKETHGICDSCREREEKRVGEQGLEDLERGANQWSEDAGEAGDLERGQEEESTQSHP